MRDRLEKVFLLILFSVMSAYLVPICLAQLLFAEDFEDEAAYKERWRPTPGWVLLEIDINGKKSMVLHINGKNPWYGYVIKRDFDDIDFEADFQLLTNYGAFVFRAKDMGWPTPKNFYMAQIAAKDALITPNHMRWSGKLNDNWVSDIKLMSFAVNSRTWYHVRFELRGDDFKCFMVEKAKEAEEELELVSESKSPIDFGEGKIGFMEPDGDAFQVDNIKVTMPEWHAVEPGGKLGSTWGKLKVGPAEKDVTSQWLPTQVDHAEAEE